MNTAKSSARMIAVTLLLAAMVGRETALADSWEYVSPMNTGRQQHGAALGSDGFIYAVGGYGPDWPDGQTLSSVERYNPTTNQWAYVADLNVARQWLAVTAGPTGRIYAVGGTDGAGGILSSMERYDPAPPADGWTVLPSMPTARMGCEAVFAGGKLYVIGGIAQTTPPWETTGIVEVYDPDAGTWCLTPANCAPSLEVERAMFGAGVDLLGRIWVFGGATDGGALLASVERYDPSITDTSDPDYGWHIVPELEMSPARQIGASCTDKRPAAYGGFIYALGGYASGHLATVEYFDPLDPASGWHDKPAMNRAINNFAAALDRTCRLYAIGGEHFDAQAEVERLRIPTNYFVACDLDGDGDVDLEDYAAFQAAFTGPQE